MPGAEKVNILLVDDQPARLLTYESVLGELDQNLVTARSGVEALAFAGARGSESSTAANANRSAGGWGAARGAAGAIGAEAGAAAVIARLHSASTRSSTSSSSRA